jgi:hypothetical protein
MENGQEEPEHNIEHSTNNGDPSYDYEELLKAKKRDVERLLVEIQKLDGPVNARSPNKMGSPKKPEEDIYRRLVAFEKDIKSKDIHIDRLTYEKKALSEIVR